MKKSRKIALTLIASACIMTTACSSNQKTKRDVYASKDDCVKDWGSDECEQSATGSRYHGPHYFYAGSRPWYFPRGKDAPVETKPMQGAYHAGADHHSPSALTSFASSKTSRGGFGHSSSFHGGGS
jgi:uncharacterized protein YgiB involved in biofilm formation